MRRLEVVDRSDCDITDGIKVIGDEDDDQIDEAEGRDRDMGFPRRFIRLALAAELVNAVLRSEKGSERHPNRITILWGSPDTIFLQNWSDRYMDVRVDTNWFIALVDSLIAWLIGGWKRHLVQFDVDTRSI
ncbi:MAG: hypothetical protein M1836_004871 [Candelina mexicana]|nr:MAG: hypothetical protein M1836_004871 [Candelina mexicana]